MHDFGWYIWRYRLCTDRIIGNGVVIGWLDKRSVHRVLRYFGCLLWLLGFRSQDNLDGIEFWICVLFGLRMGRGVGLVKGNSGRWVWFTWIVNTDVFVEWLFFIYSWFEWELTSCMKGECMCIEINVISILLCVWYYVYMTCVCVWYWRPGVFRIITPNRKDIKENSLYKKESFREGKILMKRILRENEVEIVSRIIPLLKIIFLTSIDSILKRILRIRIRDEKYQIIFLNKIHKNISDEKT